MTPHLPLDLFPLDSPSSLLRWGPLQRHPGGLVVNEFHDGRVVAFSQGGLVLVAPEVERIPLRGVALDAVLRSVGVALGWPVTENGPGPVLEAGEFRWLLSFGLDRLEWFDFDPTLPYPEAVALVARAVAGRAK